MRGASGARICEAYTRTVEARSVTFLVHERISNAKPRPHKQIVHPLPRWHPPLTSDEVESYHRDTPEWTIHDENRRIERTFKSANFAEPFAFVKHVAKLTEAEGHQPQISFRMSASGGKADIDQKRCLPISIYEYTT
jgi:hypothetical protein